MKILILNCGSSSLKYQLIDMKTESVLAKGLCERIGIDGSRIVHSPADKEKTIIERPMPDHNEAVKLVMECLTSKEVGVVESIEEVSAIGHRVVHGGELFTKSTIIDDEVMEGIKSVTDLAPLHNPANLIGIKAAQAMIPGKPNVAVFDTAFHQTMPSKAYMYAIPVEYYDKYKIRRYGFHGTSHKYVSQRAAEFLNKDIKDLKIIVAHLGNGASISAVDRGKSVDTSMGMTPLEGLVMGTRSGDIDPAIVDYLGKKENLSFDDVNNILNKKSGVLGLSKLSSDFRDLDQAAEKGDKYARLALDVFSYRVIKYIGAYIAALNGVDAIVFTAGVGENSADLRTSICKNLTYMGVKLDEKANKVRGKEMEISSSDSKVKVLVIPTNEELMIARETQELVENKK